MRPIASGRRRSAVRNRVRKIPSRKPRLAADFQVKHLAFSLWFCRGPKYQNITKVSKSVFQLKVSKYRLYRRRFLRGFRHFSAFFAIYPNILEKMRQNVKKCKNPSHQISEIFRKSAKNGHILILWLYSILWYFAGCLHFHFEICENLQPALSFPSWKSRCA